MVVLVDIVYAVLAFLLGVCTFFRPRYARHDMADMEDVDDRVSLLAIPTVGQEHKRSFGRTIRDCGTHCCCCHVCRRRNRDSAFCARSAVVRLSLCPKCCNDMNPSQTRYLPLASIGFMYIIVSHLSDVGYSIHGSCSTTQQLRMVKLKMVRRDDARRTRRFKMTNAVCGNSSQLPFVRCSSL
jgi:hypothetical protein